MYHRAKEPISLIYKELLMLEGKKPQNLKEKKNEQKMWTSHKKIQKLPLII